MYNFFAPAPPPLFFSGVSFVCALTFFFFFFVGLMVMPRTPIAGLSEEDAGSEGGSSVDASLLPPG